MRWTIYQGDVMERLRDMAEASVQTVVTSPPYWGLRDYGVTGQLGLEPTPDAYVAKMVEVFREVRRVLRDGGTLWLNLGDSYARSPARGVKFQSGPTTYMTNTQADEGNRGPDVPPGLKEKDLVGIPWRVAFALQADGWYLRSDIIWAKPNPMPESVTDRPTKSHEYVFLLTKSARYFFDAEAVKEPATEPRKAGANSRANVDRDPAHGTAKQDAVGNRRYAGFNERYDFENPAAGRNVRSVWTIATQPFPEAHFATYPEELVERCIKAGSKQDDLVLDPFTGSGTTGAVAISLGRSFAGIELNPAYVEMARRRVGSVAPLIAEEILDSRTGAVPSPA